MSAHQPTRILGAQFAPHWHRPWFRYVDAAPGGEAGTPPAAPPAGEDLGFPKDTPVDQMTDTQKVAYWQNQSKVQQKKFEESDRAAKAYGKFGTIEELQSAADAAETARRAALDDNQRAIETARAEGKAEALAESGTKHLGTAVKGMLIALTKGMGETFEVAQSRVEGAIEFADLTKFIGEDGELDAAKVQTFAQSIGSAGNGDNTQQDWRDRLRDDHQNRIPPAPGASGSVAAMEQAHYDAMKPKNNA